MTTRATADVGAAVEDATPTWSVAMAGFAARRGRSTGVHDPISVRAIVVDDTCVISIDVVGLDETICADIRSGAPFDDDRVVVTATHTHSGPAVVIGRLGDGDEQARTLIIEAGIRAAVNAAARRQPAVLEYVDAGALPIATDRRRGGKPDAAHLQGLRWRSLGGELLCWLVTYPCHPVVLGPDNRELSGDYPSVLRLDLESEAPGSVAVFLTGCAGDVNVGHPPSASFSDTADPRRTFAEAARIGSALAGTLRDSDWSSSAAMNEHPVAAAFEEFTLRLDPLDDAPPDVLAEEWRRRLPGVGDGEAAVLDEWIAWSQRPLVGLPAMWSGSVTALRWGPVVVVCLPGEPFLALGTAISAQSTSALCLVVGYANGCPGYLPTADAYTDGGYEVRDAHRYYGMPAPFAIGSGEAVGEAAVRAMTRVEGTGSG
jgi:neutral ceramidase